MVKILLFLSVFLTACQTTPPLTPEQRRNLQVRLFQSTSYETVFRGFKSVLQDEGYIINNQDMMGGLIVAEAHKTNPHASTIAILDGFNAVFSQNSHSRSDYRTSESFIISVNLEEIRKNTVEARIILRRKSFYSSGAQTGKEILRPEIYQNIFTKVSREVEKRKALKRK